METICKTTPGVVLDEKYFPKHGKMIIDILKYLPFFGKNSFDYALDTADYETLVARCGIKAVSEIDFVHNKHSYLYATERCSKFIEDLDEVIEFLHTNIPETHLNKLPQYNVIDKIDDCASSYYMNLRESDFTSKRTSSSQTYHNIQNRKLLEHLNYNTCFLSNTSFYEYPNFYPELEPHVLFNHTYVLPTRSDLFNQMNETFKEYVKKYSDSIGTATTRFAIYEFVKRNFETLCFCAGKEQVLLASICGNNVVYICYNALLLFLLQYGKQKTIKTIDTIAQTWKKVNKCDTPNLLAAIKSSFNGDELLFSLLDSITYADDVKNVSETKTVIKNIELKINRILSTFKEKEQNLFNEINYGDEESRKKNVDTYVEFLENAVKFCKNEAESSIYKLAIAQMKNTIAHLQKTFYTEGLLQGVRYSMLFSSFGYTISNSGIGNDVVWVKKVNVVPTHFYHGSKLYKFLPAYNQKYFISEFQIKLPNNNGGRIEVSAKGKHPNIPNSADPKVVRLACTGSLDLSVGNINQILSSLETMFTTINYDSAYHSNYKSLTSGKDYVLDKEESVVDKHKATSENDLGVVRLV